MEKMVFIDVKVCGKWNSQGTNSIFTNQWFKDFQNHLNRCLTSNSLLQNSSEYLTWSVHQVPASPLPVCKSTLRSLTNPSSQRWAHSYRTVHQSLVISQDYSRQCEIPWAQNYNWIKKGHTQLHRLHYCKTIGSQPGKEGRALSLWNANFMDGATLMGTRSWVLNVYLSAVSKRWASICFKQEKILVLPPFS